MLKTDDPPVSLDSPLPMFTKHPVLEALTFGDLIRLEEELGEEKAAQKVIEIHGEYETAIVNEKEDPHRYGFELEPWKDADKLLEEKDEVWPLGGNRSSKSTWAADRVIRAALANERSYILCWCQNPKIKFAQQEIIYNRLPAEYRKTKSKDINWSDKNGFTGDCIVFPNHSKIEFWTYTQYLNDRTCVEGLRLGSPLGDDAPYPNIGNWFDEYLIGPELLETMRFRLATNNAKNICTFTPVKGLSDVLSKMLKNGKWISTREAPLCSKPENKTVPYIVQPKKQNAAVIHFHSSMNPYGGYKRIKEELKGETDEQILIRAYGHATKQRVSKFPKFNKKYNTCPANQMPGPDATGTRYHIIDPAGNKSWYMIWALVDESDVIWIYREWPDRSYGAWGEWGKTNKDGVQKSKPGPAVYNDRTISLGYWDIKDLIEGLEEYKDDREQVKSENIYERVIDSRAAAARTRSSDPNEAYTTIENELRNVDIHTIPSSGKREEDGLNLIRDRFSSFEPELPVSPSNHPRLIISEDCKNLIECICEYTGEEGLKEAWKDPIDTVRYLLQRNPMYIPDDVYSEQSMLPSEPVY